VYFIRRSALDRAQALAETALGFYEIALLGNAFGDYTLCDIYLATGDALLLAALDTLAAGVVFLPVDFVIVYF
jgi:hypothetical protein